MLAHLSSLRKNTPENYRVRNSELGGVGPGRTVPATETQAFLTLLVSNNYSVFVLLFKLLSLYHTEFILLTQFSGKK